MSSCRDVISLPGSFRYRFTSPGVFYYSSGFVDDSQKKLLQGVVKVQRRAERSGRVAVSVGGVAARYLSAGTTPLLKHLRLT